VEWGLAARPYPGETASGDCCTIVPRQDGVLVAVIDALGHGVAAKTTAERVSALVERYADEPLPFLIQRCHRAVMGDRGVVMSAAVIDGARRRMTWAGVGNIKGMLLGAGEGSRRERLMAPAGIVGGQLPVLKAASLPLAAGDIVILATDGLRDGFADSLALGSEEPQQLAEKLIVDHAVPTDDALVVIVRYLGPA
jgi:serine phosphatase RsbU (regulator of sigma subunit)